MTLHMTDAHKQSLHDVLTLLESGQRLDSRHHHHRAFLKHTAEHGGLTPARYPGLHAAINAGTQLIASPVPAQSAQMAFQPGEAVIFVATNRVTNKLMARAQLSRPNTRPVAMMKLTLFIALQENGQTLVLAHGQVVHFVGQTVTVNTDPATALTCKPGTRVTAVLAYVINYQDGSTETHTNHYKVKVIASTDPDITAPIVKPNRNTGDLTKVVIGLGRGGSVIGEDVDYWFWQTQPTNPVMLVPLSGSLKTKRALADIGVNNPSLQMSLTLQEGGMSSIGPQNGADAYIQYFQLDPTDPSRRTVHFGMVATASAAGSAINFGMSPWGSDTTCYFTAVMTFLNEDLDSETFVITSTTDGADDNPVDGVAHIKPIVYVWHCLAAGTHILLADGTTKPVEHIDNRHTVACGDGTHRRVQATLAQPHHGPVVHLTFANHAHLTVSGTHPILTPSGAVQAAALKVGEHVLLDGGGHTSVHSIAERHFSGEVLYNLWLDAERPGPTHMVANGIVVGDYLVQGRLHHESKTDPVKVRARLPHSLHKDHESWLEDRAARR